jgi:hypothetical protein
MSAPTPYSVGQLSPDGMWMWDGGRWIPVQRPGQPPARRPRTWIWWLAGGCAVVLLLGIAGIVIGGAALVNRIQSGGFTCLPSDFPKYPNAQVTRVYTYVGGGVAPGDSNECQEGLSSDDDVATVTAFYITHLDTGDWSITANDKANGEIRFARRSQSREVGTVELLGRGQHTDVAIKFDS